MALTDTKIKNLKFNPAGNNEHTDTQGLFLAVTTQSKIFRFRYNRPFTKKRTMLTIGFYPEISLAQARAVRDEYRSLLAQGIDPQAHRERQAQEQVKAAGLTFYKVANDWLAYRKGRANFSAGYAKDVERMLERVIYPSFADRPIADILPRDVIEVLRPLQERGTLETIRRAIQKLNEIMIFALHRGLINENKCAHLSKEFDAPRVEHLKTIPPSELGEFMRTLSRANIKPLTRLLIQWQLLTMSRPNEAASARWQDIDLNARLWVVTVKKGIKETDEGRTHKVTLSRQAIGLLHEIRKHSRSKVYLFPSDKDPAKPCNSQTANAAIKRMGYKGKLVAHGLRSIASTKLNEQGFNKDLIEVALSHMDTDRIRAAYNRADYLERRFEMLQWWGDFVEQCSIIKML